MNGLISVTGAATLSVGAAVLALSVLSPFAAPTAIPRVLAFQAAVAVAIITVSLIGALFPSVVPAVPAPRSTPALLLLAVTLDPLRLARRFGPRTRSFSPGGSPTWQSSSG